MATPVAAAVESATGVGASAIGEAAGARKATTEEAGGRLPATSSRTGRGVRSTVRKAGPRAAPSRTAAGTSKRASGSKTTKSKGLGRKTFALATSGKGGGAHKMVIAEFLLCVALVIAAPLFTGAPDSNGHLYKPDVFVQLSAVCLLFFLLALMANHPGPARFAAAFGGLVTLGVMFNTQSVIRAVGNIFINAGTSKGEAKTADAGTDKLTVPTWSPVSNAVSNEGAANWLVSVADNPSGAKLAASGKIPQPPDLFQLIGDLFK